MRDSRFFDWQRKSGLGERCTSRYVFGAPEWYFTKELVLFGTIGKIEIRESLRMSERL